MRLPRWLFYLAVGASWLLGAEIVVLTAAKHSLPGRVPAIAGWAFVAATAFSIVVIARLELSSRRHTASLVDQLEEALGSITALTEASLSSLELGSLLDRFLERLIVVLHSEIGVIFVLDESATELEAIAYRGPTGPVSSPLQIKMSDNDGLIGRVVVTELPIATTDAIDLDVLVGRVGRRISSAAACPILIEGRLIGVCVAATSAATEFGERELHLLQLVADRSGLGIERRRLDEAERRARVDAERSRRHALVLAQASAALATARDDYRPSLAALVDVVVPEFSEWCVIDLVDSDGTLDRLAIGHLSDRGELCSAELRQRAPDLANAPRRAAETGATQLSEGLERRVRGGTKPPDGAVTADALPWISVPVHTVAGVVGVLTFAFEDGDLSSDLSEIATAADISRRVAIAIDRVRSFLGAQEMLVRSRRVANQLQQLLAASLDVARLHNDGEVIAAIAGRALAVADADCAVVTIGADGAVPLRATAEPGRAVAVGSPADTPALAELPGEFSGLAATLRVRGWLAAAIVGLGGVPLGSVAIYRVAEPGFSAEDETVLVLLARTASTALASAALYREIQASEARWRTLIEAAPIGVMEVDRTGGVRWANHAAFEILGGDVRSAGETGRVEFPAEHVERLEPLWSRAAAGVEIHDREVLDVVVGGNAKDLLVSIVPLFASDRSVEGNLTLAADISDRRRLESELRQAQRMEAVGQLAGSVAHDFNNLLTLISGYSELLRSHGGLDERELDLVRNIQDVTDRAALMTSRLLTISRRQPARPLLFDPSAALQSITEVLSKILGEEVELICDFGGEVSTIMMDPGYFDQMILNLAVNARDAMPDGGTFTVAVHPRQLRAEVASELGVDAGDYLELVVTDTGTGMDADTAAHCFDPFFTTKGPSKGTGLGLAAVRGVLAECGGAIELETAPGHGTTFVIRLPLAAPPAPSDVVALDEVVPTTDRSDVVVLVAEDDDTLRSLIVKVLIQAGYEVLSGADGEAALAIARRWSAPIDLLVTDAAMPRMSGPDLARTILADTPGIPVLFISSNTAGIVLPEGATPATAFLPKPFRPSELIARVEQLLDGVVAPHAAGTDTGRL